MSIKQLEIIFPIGQQQCLDIRLIPLTGSPVLARRNFFEKFSPEFSNQLFFQPKCIVKDQVNITEKISEFFCNHDLQPPSTY